MSKWRPSPAAREVLREVAGLHDEAETYANPISTLPNPLERRLASACITLAEAFAKGEREQAPAPGDADPTLEKALGLAPLKRKSLEKMVYPTAEPTEEPALLEPPNRVSEDLLECFSRGEYEGFPRSTYKAIGHELLWARTRLAALEAGLKAEKKARLEDVERHIYFYKRDQKIIEDLRAALRAEPGADDAE